MRTEFTGIPGTPTAPDVAVVVDVMRAFTVAAWAFRRGAERIVFAGTQREALELKARHPGWLAFQDGEPVPGFDLANSPAQLRSLDVRGRTVVQKTTAGTAGAPAWRTPGSCRARVSWWPGGLRRVHRRPGARRRRRSRPVSGPARHCDAAAELAAAVRRGRTGVHPQDVELRLAADTVPFAMAAARVDGRTVLRPVGAGGPGRRLNSPGGRGPWSSPGRRGP